MEDNIKEMAVAKSTRTKMQEIHDRLVDLHEQAKNIQNRLSAVADRALGEEGLCGGEGDRDARDYSCGGIVGEVHDTLDGLESSLNEISEKCHRVARIA